MTFAELLSDLRAISDFPAANGRLLRASEVDDAAALIELELVRPVGRCVEISDAGLDVLHETRGVAIDV